MFRRLVAFMKEARVTISIYRQLSASLDCRLRRLTRHRLLATTPHSAPFSAPSSASLVHHPHFHRACVHLPIVSCYPQSIMTRRPLHRSALLLRHRKLAMPFEFFEYKGDRALGWGLLLPTGGGDEAGSSNQDG
ncbi:hypothetical protein D9615_009654 [Tricholomella constricta]|uniref:Uncharacterized protein n=1 Tax=Tricholomella constricta TaxID=117010 RepID=A0A8H5LVT9_9AGAR|nr:hypothetical protein D9615_009654 [Tricholomella constricta]